MGKKQKQESLAYLKSIQFIKIRKTKNMFKKKMRKQIYTHTSVLFITSNLVVCISFVYFFLNLEKSIEYN